MAEGKVQIDVSRVIPIFADEAMVVSRVKAKKNEAGNKAENKEGFIEMIFLDQLGAQARAISRIVVSKNTAAGLHKILGDNLEKLGAELKSKKLPEAAKKQEKPVPDKAADKGYLG